MPTPAACRNCGAPPGQGEYCPGCGQRNRHQALHARELMADAFDQLVEWRLPWPRTMVDLLWRPGAVALDYIEGRRARYVNPVKYCFIVVAIAVALSFGADDRADDPYLVDLPANALALLSIPLQVALLRTAFWRNARTPTEIAVLCLFVTAQIVLLFSLLGVVSVDTRPHTAVIGLVVAVLFAGTIGAVKEFFAARLVTATMVATAVALVTLLIVETLDWYLVRGELPDLVAYALRGG